MNNRITRGIASLILLTAGALTVSAESYDLKAVVGMVQKHSTALKTAAIDLKLADAQADLAGSAVRPIVAASTGYKRNFKDIEVPVAAYVDNTGTGILPIQYQNMDYNSDNDFTAGFQIQQKLFDMTAFKAIEASRQYGSLSSAVYEATKQGIITAVKQVFYQNMLLKEVYKLKQETQQNTLENYEEVKLKFDNGLASELELLLAEVNWKSSLPETTQAGRNRDLALSALKYMMGLKADEELILKGSLEKYPEMPASTETGNILDKRPDYQALLKEKRLRDINISAEKAKFYPNLSASFTWGWSKSSDDFDFKDGTQVMMAGLDLVVPIYYGGSRFASLKKAKLEDSKSALALADKINDIETELNNIQLTLNEARDRIKSAEATLETAVKAYEITELSSRNGLATQLDLKDARLSRDGAKLVYYLAIHDYLNAFFQWQSAIGEGDQLPEV